MSFFDKAKNALTGAVDKHGEQIADGIDRAAEKIDDKTGGKHADKLATGAEKAKDVLDRLDGRNDDIADPATDATADGSGQHGDGQHGDGTHGGAHRGSPRDDQTSPRDNTAGGSHRGDDR